MILHIAIGIVGIIAVYAAFALIVLALFWLIGQYVDWTYRRWLRMTDREKLRQVAKWRSTN